MEFAPAPASLIDPKGKPAFGVFGEPIRKVNLHDFDCRPIAPFPFRLTRNAARVAIKRWEYIGVVSEDLVLGMAVVDIGYIAQAFAYSYLRKEKKIDDNSALDLPRNATKFSPSSVEGSSEYEKSGFQLKMDNDIVKNPRRVRLAVSDKLEADFTLDERGFEPLCIVTQNGLRGYNYCHKAAGLPVSGWVRVGGKKFDLSPANAMGVLDWSAGCPARYTYWNWASASGMLPDGRRLGLNLSSGVNERGFTENVYWVGGRPIKVDTMYFEYDPKDIMKPWLLKSADEKVSLVFTPENERKENTNLGFLMSRFRQPFGSFRGSLLIDGQSVKVNLFGFAEEHEAKW